ncbi:hypothetical protein K491DRAFT_782923 [Lophiostoma macrostomum CBS 122681]|uniref:Uncharacterized protein n=1 Tax=Lophiostoma macrostomum CBS 122681 TaxID=1314788 RepID=A0A6A6SSN7_9PLEO|nr:hypothetical protein K491DRAFT_782923 [Lophiostoma macrostomum CBS 122681]
MSYVHRRRDDDRRFQHEIPQPIMAERIHIRPSRSQIPHPEQRDTFFGRRLFEARLVEERNASVRWAYVVDSHRTMRGQAILGRIANIGPPQRRNPITKMLESIIIPMRDTDLGRLFEELKPPPSRKLIVIPFRVFKGKVVSVTRWERPYNPRWTDGDLARFILYSHRRSHSLIFYYLTKVKFLYYITVEYVEHEGQRKVKVTYTHALAYRGPRTISRFMYLLHTPSNRGQDWSLRFHDVASNVRDAFAERFIMVEIVEALDTLAILRLLIVPIAVCIGVGASYAAPTQDWSGAFGLASLAVSILAVILAVLALNQYLGMERPIDDDVSEDLGGMYRTHYTDEVVRKHYRGRSM